MNYRFEESLSFEDESYAKYMNARQPNHQSNNDIVARFLNFCATLIQKHAKGFLQRQRHKIVMMHIHRFKSLLNAMISGYKIRKILRLNDVATLREDILATDDGTYGNQQIRQKKVRLIRMINSYFETGSYSKMLKQRSLKNFKNNSQKQLVTNSKTTSRKQLDPENQQTLHFDPVNQKGSNKLNCGQDLNGDGELNHRSSWKVLETKSALEDDRHLKAKNIDQNARSYNRNQYEDDRPSNGKTNIYEENKQIKGKLSTRALQTAGEPYQVSQQVVNYQDMRPLTGKPNNVAIYEDNRPLHGKSQGNSYEDNRPFVGKPQQYAEDERPMSMQQQRFDTDRFPQSQPFNYDDERPLTGKPQSQNYQEDALEDLPILKKQSKRPQPLKKKPTPRQDELVENEFSTPLDEKPIRAKGQYNFESAEEPPNVNDRLNQDTKFEIEEGVKHQLEQQKKKKQDPKAIENLKKRTKYDPRKAIEEARRKQEEQHEIEQMEAQSIEQTVQPRVQQAKHTTPKKPGSQEPGISFTPNKIGIKLEDTNPLEPSPPKDELNSSYDNKPKNFLKRKSKQVPLNNPKVDPKAIKSKIKQCWNSEEGEVEATVDAHQSPKNYLQNKSPSRRFEKGDTQRQTQGSSFGQAAQQYTQPPIQHQLGPTQVQAQQRRVISLDELEKAYNVNYSQKLESTLNNLKLINEQRNLGSERVPVITKRSRFLQTFKVTEFDHVLSVLEDQYNRMHK